jgi:hypothetical protein
LLPLLHHPDIQVELFLMSLLVTEKDAVVHVNNGNPPLVEGAVPGKANKASLG